MSEFSSCQCLSQSGLHLRQSRRTTNLEKARLEYTCEHVQKSHWQLAKLFDCRDRLERLSNKMLSCRDRHFCPGLFLYVFNNYFVEPHFKHNVWFSLVNLEYIFVYHYYFNQLQVISVVLWAFWSLRILSTCVYCCGKLLKPAEKKGLEVLNTFLELGLKI